MNIQQAVAIQQFMYRDEIKLVEMELENMGMRPDTEIRVYPGELSWYATALVGYCVVILTYVIDHFSVDIQPFSGFYPSGGLIHRKDFPDGNAES